MAGSRSDQPIQIYRIAQAWNHGRRKHPAGLAACCLGETVELVQWLVDVLGLAVYSPPKLLCGRKSSPVAQGAGFGCSPIVSVLEKLPLVFNRIRKSALFETLRDTFLPRYYRLRYGGYFSRHELDKKLEKYVDYDNGFYVELGANDGITQSNSYHFELVRGWKGILIEPAPHKFLECLSRRGKNNTVFCNACVSFGFEQRFVEIEYSNLMSVARGLETDLEDVEAHLDRSRKHLAREEKIFVFGALAKTLNELLLEGGAPNVIDFLSLDVEGAEIEVLKGVDFDRFSFKFILVECRSLEVLSKYLENLGYVFLEQFSPVDYLFGFGSIEQASTSKSA